MGVDVDTGAFGLLEQLLEIRQVVSADQNALTGFDTQEDLGRFRIAVATGVGGIQQRHRLHTAFAGLLDQRQHFRLAKFVVRGRFERFLQECQDALIPPPHQVGVVHIRCNAFQAIDDQFAHGADIFIQLWVIHHTNGATFGKQGFNFVIFRMPASPIWTAAVAIGTVQFVAAGLGTRAQIVPANNCFLDQFNKTRSVKVGVGNGGEKRLGNEKIRLIVLDIHIATAGTPEGNPLEQINEQVLQAGYFSGFTAHPSPDAA